MTTATLTRRLEALETALGSDRLCPSCGHRCSALVQWVVADDLVGPEFCEGCGCRLWLKLQWPREGLQ